MMFFAEKKNVTICEFIIFSENSLVSNLIFSYNIPQLGTYMVIWTIRVLSKIFC